MTLRQRHVVVIPFSHTRTRLTPRPTSHAMDKVPPLTIVVLAFSLSTLMWHPPSFIDSSQTLHSHPHTSPPSHNSMRPFTVSSRVFPFALSHKLSSLPLPKAFDLAHPMRSSSTSISLTRSLEWHMLIRPFKEIATRLAHLWSCLRLPNPLRISFWDILPGRGRYRHYRCLAEEQRWWDESARIRAFFAPLDARLGKVKGSAPECLSPIPLIMSYVPRLLPQYRDHSRLDDSANDYDLTPSTYRKWCRLVFPNKVRLHYSRGARGEEL